MSVVSRQLDFFTIPKPVRNAVPVGFSAGPPQYPIYAQPEQKAHFNVSKNIRKPIRDVAYTHGTMGNVPLYCHQFGADVPKLFVAPNNDLQVLKVPIPVPTNLNLSQGEEYVPQFQMGLPYNEGIRPSVRFLRETEITEPAGPMFRPAGAKFGLYRPQQVPMMYLPEDEIVRQVRNL